MLRKEVKTMAQQTNRDIFRTIEEKILKSQRKYERQGFTVELPTWFTDLQQRAAQKGKRITKKMLSEAEKLAKNFKKTTVPKAEREAEKTRKRNEREISKMPKHWQDYYDELEDKSKHSYDYDEYSKDDELFHPQYEDEEYEEELPDEASAVLQEVITLLEDALSNGIYSADELLLSIQTAIDTEGYRKVAKGIASVGDELKDAIQKMGYWSEKVNADYESEWSGKALGLIKKGIYGTTDLAGSGSNGYGL